MRNLILSFLLLSASSLGAQDLISHIPADATFLFSWNAGQVGEKVNTRQLLQQESVDLLFQELVKGLDSLQQEEYFNLLTNPETYGIGSGRSMHLLGRNNGAGSFYAVMFPLTDPLLLEDFVARQAMYVDMPPVIEEMDGFKMVNMGRYTLGWNETVGVIADGEALDTDYEYDYDYTEVEEDYPYYEEEEAPLEIDGEIAVEEAPEEEIAVEEAPVVEEIAMEESPEEIKVEEVPVIEDIVIEEAPQEEYAEEDWYYDETDELTDPLADWIGELLNRSFERSLETNADYLQSVAKPADAHLWVDYRQFMTLSQGGLGSFGGQSMAALGGAAQLVDQMYQGVYLTMALNFNQGALELESQMVGDGKMVEVMKDAYNTKFNKKMLKYVDGRELLGYYTLRFDVEALVEGFKDIFLAAMADMPMFGQNFSGITDVLGIIIDEDALYDLFKGDILVAMTGVRQSETPVTTYEYDEDFNPSQVEKTIKKHYPEFVVLASYGNEENMMKIVRLAESFNALLSMGNYYQIPGGADGEAGSYLALKDGVLLFTNNATLIQEKLGSGVQRSARLAKVHRKNLRKHVQALYWDVQATWNAVQQTEATNADEEIVVMMEKVKGQLETISMLTSRKTIRTKITLELMDKESNALEQVINLINQVILEATGLERI